MKSKTHKKLQIIRLSPKDVLTNSDILKKLVDRISREENMYPGIDLWLKKKVVPGIMSCERVAFLCLRGENPVAAAILKRGKSAKFCHLKIDDKEQDQHLGELFFTLMALETTGEAKNIYFTLPESLWLNKKNFFHSFGFSLEKNSGKAYRRSESELVCRASISKVLNSVNHKTEKIFSNFRQDYCYSSNSLLLSIKPKFANKILDRTKSVEVRRKFNPDSAGKHIVLYASSPVKRLVGEALIKSINKSDPETIWGDFGSQIGCTKEEFDEYAKGAEQISAIFLENVIPFANKVSLANLKTVLDRKLHPPVSHSHLHSESNWSDACFFATLNKNKTIKSTSIN